MSYRVSVAVAIVCVPLVARWRARLLGVLALAAGGGAAIYGLMWGWVEAVPFGLTLCSLWLSLTLYQLLTLPAPVAAPDGVPAAEAAAATLSSDFAAAPAGGCALSADNEIADAVAAAAEQPRPPPARPLRWLPRPAAPCCGAVGALAAERVSAVASTLKGQGAEIAALRRQGALLHSANDALKDANDALSDEVRRLSLEAEQRQQMLAQREALLAELQAESDRLRQALAAARQEYRDLEVCNRALSHDWEASQLALEALQQTLAQRMTAADHHEDDGRAGQPHTLPYLERRIAHYRGLWGQLKEQFADKTEQLDLCRKELFGCQEELLCAKRELAERELLWQEQQLVQQCRLVGQLHESALPALQDQSITPFLEELIAFSAATG